MKRETKKPYITWNKRQFEQKMREYRKFLEDDDDYDAIFAIRLFRYKLARTAKRILKDKIISERHQVAREIRDVVKLLKRVEEDRYEVEALKEFHRKYGRSKLLKGPPNDDGSIPVTIKYSKETLHNQRQRRNDLKRALREAEKNRVNDLNTAFRLIAKNIWGWWD